MKYFSADHKILTMAYKVSQGAPTIRERLSTDGKFDREKARQLLKDRGFTLIQLAAAITRLVSAGYIDADGITQAGIDKIAQIEADRETAIDNLGLRPFFSGETGKFNQADMDTLANTDF